MKHIVFIETTKPGIQAIEIAKQAGYRVSFVQSGKFNWLLTEAELIHIRALVDSLTVCIDSQTPELVFQAIKNEHIRFPVHAIISTLHQCTLSCSYAASSLGLHATPQIGIQNARNKMQMRTLLEKSNIPSARSALVSSIDDAISALEKIHYPAIIKPNTGVGKILTNIIYNEVQLYQHFQHAYAQWDKLKSGLRDEITFEFIIEELLEGPLYSIEVGVSALGEIIPFVILRRKTALHNAILEMGSTIPCGLNDYEYNQSEQYVIQIVKELELSLGIFHVEFIYTKDGPRLIEVNPRIAGGSIPDLIYTTTGCNLFEQLIKIYLGEEIQLGRLPVQISASHSFIAVQENCTVKQNLESNWFEVFSQKLHSGHSTIQAGQFLKKMEGNYDLYGVIRITAQDYLSARHKISNLYKEIETLLGVQLVEINDD